MERQNMSLRRIIALVCVFVLVFSVFAGCSGKTEEKKVNNQTSGVTEKEAPYKITMMVSMMFTEPPKKEWPVMQEIMKYTNTDLEIAWSPGGGPYEDKLNAAIAAGDLPMAPMSFSNRNELMINATRSGMFWEIGPYLSQFPNLSKFNKQIHNNTAVDGKIYQLPRWRDLTEDGMTVRRDWMDNLKLKDPKNIDELYNMIKAFGTKDPDQNGKDDTLGLVEYFDLRGFNWLLGVFGAPNNWEVKDGKLSPAIFTDEYLNAMKFMKRLYEEKLLNQDFALIKRDQRDDFVNKGQAGLFIAGIDQCMRVVNLPKTFPKAVVDVISRVAGPKGEKMLASKGYNGAFFFPKKSVKTEADLKKVLGFFDKLHDEKLQNVFAWGIEGRHYSLKDGKPIRTEEQNNLFAKEGFELNDNFLIVYKDKVMKGAVIGLNEKWKEHNIKNQDMVVYDPAAPFISPTFLKKSTELDAIYKDARTKFIMGKIDEAGWKDILQKWRQSGGDAVTKELNDEYAKVKK